MNTEPLIPLARAVASEIERLEAELGVELGAVRLDLAARAVVVHGDGLKAWGPRTMLESRLTRCGLRHETHAPDMYLVIYPSGGQSADVVRP